MRHRPDPSPSRLDSRVTIPKPTVHRNQATHFPRFLVQAKDTPFPKISQTLFRFRLDTYSRSSSSATWHRRGVTSKSCQPTARHALHVRSRHAQARPARYRPRRSARSCPPPIADVARQTVSCKLLAERCFRAIGLPIATFCSQAASPPKGLPFAKLGRSNTIRDMQGPGGPSPPGARCGCPPPPEARPGLLPSSRPQSAADCGPSPTRSGLQARQNEQTVHLHDRPVDQEVWPP